MPRWTWPTPCAAPSNRYSASWETGSGWASGRHREGWSSCRWHSLSWVRSCALGQGEGAARSARCGTSSFAAQYALAIAGILRKSGVKNPALGSPKGPVAAIGAQAIKRVFAAVVMPDGTRIRGKTPSPVAFAAAVRSGTVRPHARRALCAGSVVARGRSAPPEGEVIREAIISYFIGATRSYLPFTNEGDDYERPNSADAGRR